MPEAAPAPPRRVYSDPPQRPWWTYAALVVGGLAVIALLLKISSPDSNVEEPPQYVPPPSEKMNDVLLASVVGTLDRLEDFAGEQAVVQTLERLNQWLRSQRLDPAWQPDPIVAGLPEVFRQLPMVRNLRQPRFVAFDANHLQEVVLLRNLARVARGDEINDLSRAQRLFDWVVRNVELDPPHDSGTAFPVHLVRQTMVMGRGTVEERAWAFVLLARQQGLEAIVLALPGPAGAPPRLWATAVLIEGELYLFDPRLGLPLPGANRQGVATLRQLKADEQLLRQLDLGPDERYPVTADGLAGVHGLIEASPAYLCQRMALVEGHLTGDDRLVLTCHPTELAKRLSDTGQLASVGIWAFPYEQLLRATQRPFQEATLREATRYRIDLLPDKPVDFRTPVVALQKGRLFHLKGRYVSDGREPSANALYQLARPTSVDIELASLPEELRAGVVVTKQDATYWLGMVAFERGDYATAIDYLKERTLETWPDGPWTNGARYNLARCYEAQGDPGEAAAWYRADRSDQRPGSLLRAKWLEESAAAGKPSSAPPAESAAAGTRPPVESAAIPPAEPGQPAASPPTSDATPAESTTGSPP